MKSKRNEINNVYVLDFESRNSEKDIKANKSSIWLWDICSLDGFNHITGYDIDSFIDQLRQIAPATIYSHNLKFDGSFIIYYLYKHNFKYLEDTQNLEPNSFNCLISGDNDIYYIRICFESKKGSRVKQLIELRDSTKKIKGSVSQIALSYNLPIKKLEINHNLERPLDYQPTNEEIEYVRNDTEIIARVLNIFYEKDMTSLTASADAFKMYKKDCGNSFRFLFPVLPIEIDDYIRRALKGGLCYINPKHRGRTLNDVTILDANSFYPFIASTMPLPYGKPEYFVGEPHSREERPLFISHIKVCCKLKKDHIPTLQLKQFYMYGKNEFVLDTMGEMIDLYLTNIDIDSMYESYDIYDIEYIDGFYFLCSHKLFKRYISILYKLKDESIGAQRETNKILLNGLLGKFATKTQFVVLNLNLNLISKDCLKCLHNNLSYPQKAVSHMSLT